MALLSLGFLLLAIMLGFIRKMNTGLLCIAFALLLGRMAGISDAEIIKGFNASLFLMLLGVTYLFSLAQINGSLDLLAQKVISLAGKRVYLIPVIIYVFSIILAALGPGSVPTMAIMMVFSMGRLQVQIEQDLSSNYISGIHLIKKSVEQFIRSVVA